MVDCGLMFPDEDHLGVDVLIPHFGAVRSIRDKLLGILLTHGHEDHIGALPWIVTELNGARILWIAFYPGPGREQVEGTRSFIQCRTCSS